MEREPAITFRGALRILGHHDRPWVDRLDRLLGGVILAAGVATATEAAVFGWVDQKNEATGLLRKALDTVSNRLLNTGGLARHELVIAAHTTMVLAGFWETLATTMWAAFREAELSSAEKIRLGTGKWHLSGDPLIRHLFEADIPAPSAIKGFEENVADVRAWAERQIAEVNEFLYKFGATQMGIVPPEDVADRYRADYLALATKVPEFKVWADLGEHAATRAALSRLESLLTPRAQDGPRPHLRAQLREINRAELSRPIIDIDVDGYGIDAIFPPVRDIFVDPRYTVRSADHKGQKDDRPEHAGDDLDVVLARHFSTADATRLPLLLLGHPGAGKSLLMKVLAARLPEPTYTVVRVPLRRVNADANVVEQIQRGLLLGTNGNVTWSELAKECDDVIRVVLLDGLDELLQATRQDRGGYLAEVMEFQRVETALGRPVAVVVTSRTLVADRVRVPGGVPVVTLSEFDDAQIDEWITAWNAVNPNVRRMTPELAAQHAELARQPLLLLMLTLYFADPEVELPDHDLSTVELYERLLGTYARREVTKQAGRVLPDDECAEAVRTQLTRLAAAALGMFNRGRQSITEAELSADLIALGEPAPIGRRVLGEFFFVHSPEAGDGEQRAYEFLHATFAEYLVATRVVEVLAEVAEGSFGRKRFHEPDDQLLFALLSHQPLAIQRPVLDFVKERLATLTDAERVDVIKTLDLLVRAHRNHATITTYQPTPPDAVRALAAYSANLVLARLLADHEGVLLSELFPGDADLTVWRATVRLWSAGLDVEGFLVVVSAIRVQEGRIVLRPWTEEDNGYAEEPPLVEFNAAVLRGDDDTARRLRFSHALLDNTVYGSLGGTWRDESMTALLNLTMGYTVVGMSAPPATVSEEDMLAVARVAYGVLGVNSVHWDLGKTDEFLRWLLALPVPAEVSALPLMLAGSAHGKRMLMNLRESPETNWSRAAIGLLDNAIAEDIDHLVGVARYLESVLPEKWDLDFIGATAHSADTER